MEKQEKNQLKDLLKKYIDSTSMDSDKLMSVEEVLSMLDDSSENGEPIKGEFNLSPEDYLKGAGLQDKISVKNSNKKSATELNEELEEANEFLKYVTNMYANAFGIDESELEDLDNDDSHEDSYDEYLDNGDSYDSSVSVFDLDIKEANDIYDNLYDWGLEDTDVDIDKDGNVLVYGLFPEDIPHFTEAFNDAFSKDMTQQDITDYLKDAYNRYNNNKPLKDSYEEGYPIGDDLRNGRVFLKDMVVKFPPMGSEEEKEYELFQDFDNFMEPKNYHYYVDGVKYIISKLPEKESFEILDKRFPLYDDADKQLPFSISLDKMMVTGEKENFELNKLKYNDGECQYYSFENGDKLFIIYKSYFSTKFRLSNTLNI